MLVELGTELLATASGAAHDEQPLRDLNETQPIVVWKEPAALPESRVSETAEGVASGHPLEGREPTALDELAQPSTDPVQKVAPEMAVAGARNAHLDQRLT